MIIQNRDGSLIKKADGRWTDEDASTCYADVPAELLTDQRSLFDRIVNLAFDVFGAQRLDVRVYEDEHSS